MRYVFPTSGTVEKSHYTLFAIVESDDVVKACLQASKQLVGDLDEPNTGVFAAWPLAIVKGLPLADESDQVFPWKEHILAVNQALSAGSQV